MITVLNSVMRTSVYRLVARLVLLFTLVAGTTGTAFAQTVTYFHNDIAGTPQVATNAAGAVVWKENYLPYGYRQVADPASSSNKLWFTGKAYDPDTQLSYMGARYYMPLLGRFTGIDPVEFVPEQPHSFNRYAYANNNPYRYVDPDGRYAIPLLALATVLVVAGNSDAMKPENIALRAKSLSQAGERLSNALSRASNWVFNEGADTPAGDKPTLESNPKHHPNSVSPEPSNVDELYDNSAADSKGVRWAKDEKGELNRFSKPSNGQTHWNGTTDPNTVDPIKPQNIPNEIKKLFGYK
jgi:RHS repeat-associated protein